MTVRKGLGVKAVIPSFRQALRQREACKLANLVNIHNQIRKMARTKMILSAARKPIMAPALEEEIEAALMRYDKRSMWTAWGLDELRKQGNMVFLSGPPGTGKTVIAQYMSKRIGRGLATLNMKDVGGKAPGQTERGTAQFFEDARLANMKTVFMDECESIIWDRNRAGSDSMWMVGVIDEILVQTAKYPGLVVAASNRPDIVDEALLSRCFASLHVGFPEAPERIRLWRQKMPARFPLQLTQAQIERLSECNISGRDIENAIVREASMSLTQGREPRFLSLLSEARKFVKA